MCVRECRRASGGDAVGRGGVVWRCVACLLPRRAEAAGADSFRGSGLHWRVAALLLAHVPLLALTDPAGTGCEGRQNCAAGCLCWVRFRALSWAPRRCAAVHNPLCEVPRGARGGAGAAFPSQSQQKRAAPDDECIGRRARAGLPSAAASCAPPALLLAGFALRAPPPGAAPSSLHAAALALAWLRRERAPAGGCVWLLPCLVVVVSRVPVPAEGVRLC